MSVSSARWLRAPDRSLRPAVWPISDRMVSNASLSFFFSSRRRHTRFDCDWSSDVCSSDLPDTDLDAPRHTWFERPIALTHQPYIDQTYRYGSTMGGNFQQHQGVEFNNPDGDRKSVG